MHTYTDLYIHTTTQTCIIYTLNIIYESFYSSASPELFTEALDFVRTLTDISETDVSMMIASLG